MWRCCNSRVRPSIINYDSIKTKICNYNNLDKNDLQYIKSLTETQKCELIRIFNICMFNLYDSIIK